MRTELFGPPPPPVRPDLAAARRDGDRMELAETLVAYQREIGAPAAAVEAAARLADPDAAVIVTGQQPGLLGGPMLVLAKALSAIAWAERLAAESGRPVVPVFWAATEDHDLPEVNRVELLDAEDRPVRLSLPIEPDGRMLSEIRPGDLATELLARVAETLPKTDFSEETLRPLAPPAGATLGTWFASILTSWLGDRGLVVVEPRHLRRAAAVVAERERSQPGTIAAAMAPGPVVPHAPPFFLVEDGRRRRPGSSAEFAAAAPDRISWDVLTRVLAQNVALPVAGHVVGPSEAKYVAQTAPAHALFGIPAPPLLPRASLVIVEGKVEKALGRFGTTVPEVLERGEAALDPGELKPGEFDEALTRLEKALEAEIPALNLEAGRVDETLLRKAEGAERELLAAIDRLRDHARKAMERVTGQDAERRRKVLAHLLPGGDPPDRRLSPLPFLNRHGRRLLNFVAKAVAGAPDRTILVYMKGR